eukprot:m.305649 g.305649  ORF g.305649 m.305649 type:complete len:455 (+) comp15910_c2_seq1:140-1504(+)
MAACEPVQLQDFFIYNNTFGQREENEHEKLFFFHPNTASLGTQMYAVGLSEAVVQFTGQFAQDTPPKALHAQKSRRTFLNPEPNFWMSMSVKLPVALERGNPVHLEEDVQDEALHVQLVEAYEMFKLFNGTLQANLESRGREQLIDLLACFFKDFIHALNVKTLSVVETFRGLQFLPLDKLSYMKIQSFVHLVKERFPPIKHCLIIQGGSLVWSGLEQPDTRTLYHYLTKLHVFEQFKTPQQASKVKSGFVIGPEDIDDVHSPVISVLCHITVSGEPVVLNLIVYQGFGMKCCFLISPKHNKDIVFYQKLNQFMQEHVSRLDLDRAGKEARRSDAAAALVTEQDFKYLYLNHMNLAHKCTFMPLLPGMDRTPRETFLQHLNLMGKLQTTILKEQGELEIIARLANDDTWVVATKSDARELYAILPKSLSNLSAVHEEFQKHAAAHFFNIFFMNE